MKLTILISTLIFVTLSFVGIASYYRYNNILREKGLYAPEKHTKAKEKIEKNKISQMDAAQEEAEILQQLQQNNSLGQEQNVQQNIQQQAPPKKAAQKKKIKKEAVLASKHKVKREINFNEFSRAPLREPEEEESVEVREDRGSKEAGETVKAEVETEKEE